MAVTSRQEMVPQFADSRQFSHHPPFSDRNGGIEQPDIADFAQPNTFLLQLFNSDLASHQPMACKKAAQGLRGPER